VNFYNSLWCKPVWAIIGKFLQFPLNMLVSSCDKSVGASNSGYRYNILRMNRNITHESDRARSFLHPFYKESKHLFWSKTGFAVHSVGFVGTKPTIVHLCPLMGSDVSLSYYANGRSHGSCVVLKWHFTWLLRPESLQKPAREKVTCKTIT
jgi:hypothetical protein